MSSHAIGQIESTDGEVFVIRVDGTEEPLNEGDAVFEGDVLGTGPDSTLSVVFIDNTVFALEENAQITVDEMIYDPAAGEGSAAVSVLQGVFVFVTGEIADAVPENMLVRTPVATIGIRGTEVAGRLGVQGEDSLIVLIDGEITVTNAAGAVIMNIPGQATLIADFFTTPQQPFVMTPEQIEELFGQAFDLMFERFGELTPEAGQGQVIDLVDALIQALGDAGAPLLTLTDLTGKFHTITIETGDEIDVATGDRLEFENLPLELVRFDVEGDDLRLSLPDGRFFTLVGAVSAVSSDDPATLFFAGGQQITSFDMLFSEVSPAAGPESALAGPTQGGTFRADGTPDASFGGSDQGPGSVVGAGTFSAGIEGAAVARSAEFEALLAAGKTGDQLLIGSNNDDFLRGGFGNDVIAGAGGNDTLIGGIGNDLFVGGPGNDVIDGGPGFDTVRFDGPRADYAFSVGSLVITDLNLANGDDGTDILSNIEQLLFTDIAIPPPLLVSVFDVSVDATGKTATITVKLSQPNLTDAVSVTVTVTSGSAALGVDFNVVGGARQTLTIAPGDIEATIGIQILGDALTEGEETFNIALSNAVNADIADIGGTVVGAFTDLPRVSVADGIPNPAVEAVGAAVTFTVSLSEQSDRTVAVDFTTADGSALAGQDYVAAAGTVVFFAGETVKQITVTVLDNAVFEPGEAFTVVLSNALRDPGGLDQLLTVTDGTGTGTIADDDALPTFAIGDVAVTEGTNPTITFTVTKSGLTEAVSSVAYQVNPGSATTPGDYTAGLSPLAGTLTFAAGETVKTITLNTADDALFEATESFTVDLSGAVNATIADNQAIGTILNDDAPPTFSIGDVAVTEGTDPTITFTVTKSGLTQQVSSVAYQVNPGAATTPGDYTAGPSPLAGTLTFAAGETTKTIILNIADDALFEATESFTVDLSGAVNATIADNQAIGTIDDDDLALPVVSIADATPNPVVEGPGIVAALTVTFRVTLDAATTATVTVDFTTVDGSATAGQDYVAQAGPLTFLAGEMEQFVTVEISNDNISELDQAFTVVLSNARWDPTGLDQVLTIADNIGAATIVDDDPLPTFSIGDVAVTEGTDPTITFTVTKGGLTEEVSSVVYQVNPGSAITPDDYTAGLNALTGTLTFAANETVKTITLNIADDGTFEPTESFTVDLSGAVNATIADNQAIGTVDDDDPPLLTWTGGGGGNLWSTAANWDPARVPQDNDNVVIPAIFAGTVEYNANSGTTTLNALAVDGGELIVTGGTLNLAAASTVGGTLSLSGGTLGGAGDLVVDGRLEWDLGTITGSGALTVDGFAQISTGAAKDLDGRTLTLAGTGNIFNATVNGSGTLENTGTLSVTDTFFNITVTNAADGILTVQGGTTNVDGTFNNEFRATLKLEGNSSAGNAALTVDSDLNNAGTLELTTSDFGSGAVLEVNGTLINDGTISSLVGSGGGTRVIDAEIDNRGLIDVDQSLTINNLGSTFTSIAGRVDVTLGQTLNVANGTTEFGGGTVLFGSGTIDLQGALTLVSDFTLSGTAPDLVIFGGAGTTISGPGKLTNQGTMKLDFDTVNTAFDNEGTLLVEGSVTINGAFSNAASGTITVAGAGFTALLVPGGFTNAGNIELSNTAAGMSSRLITNSGTLTNTGTITSSVGAGGGTRAIQGNFDNQNLLDIDQSFAFLNSGFAVKNSGTIDIAAGQTFTVNSGTFDNLSGGVVQALGSISLNSATSTNAGTIDIASGQTLTVSGGSLLNDDGGVLQGAGNVSVASTSFTNAGTLSPGDGVGTLNIAGNVTHSATAQIDIEIGGTGAGQFDVLNISGTATLAGTLDVALINAFAPVQDQGFEVLTAGSIDGTFDNFAGLDLGNGLVLFPDFDADSLTLRALQAVSGDANANTLAGGTGGDLIDGQGGADSLSGGAGNDVLIGGAGNDTLSGDGDADTFKYADPADGLDTITDFDTLEGDVLDLADVLQGAVGTGNLADFVQFADDNTDITVRIDADGGGGFTDLVVLQGVTGVTAVELLNSGNLEV